MRRILSLLPLIAMLAGCACHDRCAPPGDVRMANLALGPTAEHAWLAERIAPRSSWPAIDVGLRVESTTYYNTIVYDEESHYGRYGSVYHATESIETGVWVR